MEQLFDSINDLVDEVLQLQLLLALHNADDLSIQSQVTVLKHLLAGLFALLGLRNRRIAKSERAIRTSIHRQRSPKDPAEAD